MNKTRFSSRLDPNDIKIFLTLYANMSCCEIIESVNHQSRTLYYIKHKKNEYVLKCADFTAKLFKMFDNVEATIPEVRPDENDWLCFMKRKFGKEYQACYAVLFDVKDIIFNEPMYISRIDYNEFVILIKNLFDYEKKVNTSNIEIIEVESFFQTERRFFISGPNLQKSFYMRISDFQVICPRSLSYKFRIIMSGMFDQEYTKAYSNSFKCIVDPDICIKEFKPKEAMA